MEYSKQQSTINNQNNTEIIFNFRVVLIVET